MNVSYAGLSRIVSHALRHEPWRYELELDEEGWVNTDQLVEAIRRSGAQWVDIDRLDVERMVTSAAKHRHEIAGDQIRALYGHSVPARIGKVAARPPSELYHGTSPAAWSKIREIGLSPMARQYVHLSADVETAIQVGKRKSSIPVLIAVDCSGANSAGVAFYKGNEKVWLADFVPASFIKLISNFSSV